jgi:hypothetical protein
MGNQVLTVAWHSTPNSKIEKTIKHMAARHGLPETNPNEGAYFGPEFTHCTFGHSGLSLAYNSAGKYQVLHRFKEECESYLHDQKLYYRTQLEYLPM